MKLTDRQKIFTRDVALLIAYAYRIGLEIVIKEALRTKEQQEIYVKQGKSQTHNSMHLNSLAVDFIIIDPAGRPLWEREHYRPLAEFWESLHRSNRAGFFWVERDADALDDPYHFEHNSTIR